MNTFATWFMSATAVGIVGLLVLNSSTNPKAPGLTNSVLSTLTTLVTNGLKVASGKA